MTKVAVGVPSYGNGKADFWNCLDELRQYSKGRNLRLELLRIRSCFVEHARNVIASRAWRGGFDYVLFLDDDLVFGPDLLVRLLSHRKAIVMAPYYRKQVPHVPVVSVLNREALKLRPVFVDPRDDDARLYPVNAGGTGACLIDTRVFAKLPFPWFILQYSEPLEGDPPKELTEGMVLIGEDTGFFMRVHQYDFSVYCDFSIKIGHIGEKTFTYEDFLHESEKMSGSDRAPDRRGDFDVKKGATSGSEVNAETEPSACGAAGGPAHLQSGDSA